MKKIHYKSILLILCLSMFSSVLSLGFVRAELSTASPGGLTETIEVFNHQTATTTNPAIATITIQDMPVESVIMELVAHNADRNWWRAIHFDVDGYLDGIVGPPPGVGGGILVWREARFQVRGPGVLYYGPYTKSFTIDMSTECYFATDVNYEKFYHNFVPQDPSQTVGYFSPGDHIITSFVTAPGSAGNSWVTIRLHITYKFIPDATVDFDPDTLNLKSEGKYISVYIELPGDYGVDAADIDPATVKLNGLPALLTPEPVIGDNGGEEGILDLMVKFNREDIKNLLMPMDPVLITVSGETFGGIPFEGIETTRLIH